MTGKNPGKHGVYHFHLPTKTSYLRRRLIDSTTVRSEKLWNLLNRSGLSVGLIDVPLLYPPSPVEGYMVAGGPLAPSEKANFTFPPSLHTELLRELGDFPLYFRTLKQFRSGNLIRTLRELYGLTRNRRRASLYLLTSHPTDFFMIVYRGTDFLQHYGWRFWDDGYQKRHPAESRKLRDVIPQYYEEMDAAIGELIAAFDGELTVFIISDHGAGPLYKFFYVNAWLRQEGFLAVKRFPKGWPYRPVRGCRALPRVLGRRRIPWPTFVKKYRAELVDWRRTRAYGNFTGDEPAITLNVKGRDTWGTVNQGSEYEDVREEIIRRLKALRDPDTGLPVVEQVYRREEVYSGPYVDEAPDIAFIPREWLYRPRGDLDVQHPLEAPESLTPATHRMDGILIAWGKHIRHHEGVSDAQIIDLAPSVLHLFGLPIPDDIDGKVLTEILTPEFMARHPVQQERVVSEAREVGGEVFSEEERKQVEEGLRALGYID